MFTGLIEEAGAVIRKGGRELVIHAQTVLEDLKEGDSIAVNGACLTAVKVDAESFVVQTSPETLERTTLGQLSPGDAVNLERSLAVGDRLGGHFVQGHVDGVGRVHSVVPQGEFSMWRFQAPVEVARYLVPKGSITVDGISLTVVDPQGDTFGVAVIPETIVRTTLGNRRPGDAVNLEADLLGKYIYQFLQGMRGGSRDITPELLRRHGFM